MSGVQGGNGFAKHFNNPDYADIIATVDNIADDTSVQYYMHQFIVCTESEQFKSLCSAATADKQGRKLISFSTTPAAFELMARWVYGDRTFDICDDVNVIHIALNDALDSEMEDFRVALLKRLIVLKEREVEAQLPFLNRLPETRWKILEDTCERALARDRSLLTEFVQRAIPDIRVSAAWLDDLAAESEMGRIAAVLLEKYQSQIQESKTPVRIPYHFPPELWSAATGESFQHRRY
ncbi:hypothetical protein TWF281_003720 [Arthrobotrys megalospora]